MIASPKFDKFTLGPLLPDMEKHYGFLLHSALLQKVKDDNSQLFTMVYFSYEFSGKSRIRHDKSI